MFMRHRVAQVAVIVLGILAYGAPAWAGPGGVLPANAKAKGYSLSAAASATAVYNTGGAAPDVPFTVLFSDTTVKPGTMLYVPIFFADNSPPITGDFPANVTNHEQDVFYYYDPSEYGFQYFFITVDKKTTIISSDYLVGVNTAPLADGGGTQYIVSAAFLTPLTPGTHTISIGGAFNGTLIGSSHGRFTGATYTVTVAKH